VVTPTLEGTILAGVTRDCILTLLRDLKVPVEERRVAFADLQRAHADGNLEELFGTGTASLVAPIGELAWEGGTLSLPAPGPASLGDRLRAALSAIQSGEAEDRHGWLEAV
jgi:branched-chain amino acid aminotransferase